MQKQLDAIMNYHIPLAAALTALLLLNGIFNLLLYREHRQETAQLQKNIEALQMENAVLGQEIAELTVELNELKAEYDSYRNENEERFLPGGGERPTAYLTFDDGPSENTIKILEILADYNIKATFFPIGYNHSGDENIYKRIFDEGHALGNHTYTHHYPTIYRSANAFMADLLRLEEVIYQQTGMRPDMVRLPGGTSNTVGSSAVIREIIAILLDLGYDYFDWNVYSGDSCGNQPPGRLVDNVLSQVDRMGGVDLVILHHDSYINHNTAAALPQIIEGLQARGYRFAPLARGVIDVKHR